LDQVHCSGNALGIRLIYVVPVSHLNTGIQGLINIIISYTRKNI